MTDDISLKLMFLRFLRSSPILACGFIIIVALALLVSVGTAAEGSFKPAIRASVYIILLLFLTALYLKNFRDVEIFSLKNGHVVRLRVRHLAAAGLVATSLASMTWLMLTSLRYFQERELFCGKIDQDQEVETEQERSLATDVFGFAFGIEPWPSHCATRETRITVVAQPQYEFARDGKISSATTKGSEITLNLPFSHRRSSCDGTTRGKFEACLPEGFNAKSAEILSVKSRNKADEPKDGHKISSDEEINCIKIPWSATSGGRTGIGECRYHGSISFVVALSGEAGDEAKNNFDDAAKTATVRGNPNKIFISFADIVLPKGANNLSTKALTEWDVIVNVGQWEKRWFREVKLWEDTAGTRSNVSSCLNVEPTDDPAGYWITIDCNRSVMNAGGN